MSRSTYKVTTFIEFRPYIESFRKFQRYLETFLVDLADPTRVSAFSHLLSRQLTPEGQDLITSIITRSRCDIPAAELCSDKAVRIQGKQVISVSDCLKQAQLICRAVQQYRAIANATEYIKTAFEQVKEEFMSVIDHLETEQDETNEEARDEHNEKVDTKLKRAYTRISKTELEDLATILEEVKIKVPGLEKDLKRHKRFGIMFWIMGWGVYSNWRQIRSIKKNVKKLYEQNLLQEQQIQDLALILI